MHTRVGLQQPEEGNEKKPRIEHRVMRPSNEAKSSNVACCIAGKREYKVHKRSKTKRDMSSSKESVPMQISKRVGATNNNLIRRVHSWQLDRWRVGAYLGDLEFKCARMGSRCIGLSLGIQILEHRAQVARHSFWGQVFFWFRLRRNRRWLRCCRQYRFADILEKIWFYAERAPENKTFNSK